MKRRFLKQKEAKLKETTTREKDKIKRREKKMNASAKSERDWMGLEVEEAAVHVGHKRRIDSSRFIGRL